MNYPDHEEISRGILLQDGLTGAELEVLLEYTMQPASAWECEVLNERAGYVMTPSELVEFGIANTSAVEAEGAGYATALVKRVNEILQNHAL